MKRYDTIIIGAGSVGGTIALRLAGQGQKVALVALPGEPETFHQRQLLALTHGKNPPLTPSFLSDVENAASATDAKSSPLDSYAGECHFETSKSVTVNGEPLGARYFVIAAGAKPYTPPIQGLEETPTQTPLALFSTAKWPASVLIVGGGPFGIATAARLISFGTAVILFEKNARLLPHEDPDISEAVKLGLEKQGVIVHLNAHVVQVRSLGEAKTTVVWEKEGVRDVAAGGALILATGLLPNTAGLALDRAGVFINKQGAVAVDEEMKTSAPSVWAAGSVTGAFNLSLEQRQAELVAENIAAPFFSKQKLEPGALPFAIPSLPPIARVGLTEPEARSTYKDVYISRCSLGTTEGLIKLVARRRSGELLGAHIFGVGAEEMILFFDLVLRAGISLNDLAEIQHYPALTPAATVHRAISEWIRIAQKP